MSSYRVPPAEFGGGGIENVTRGEDMVQLAHDYVGVHIIRDHAILTLTPDEAERVARVLTWHAMRARGCAASFCEPPEDAPDA